jgi:catechol 2,3-dioxygenase-like lactoylglutathione lyase family enzyme
MSTSYLKRANTILYCRNWKNTVRFYRDTLKFSVNYKRDWFIEFHLTESSYLSIADASSASIKSADGDGVTLSWQVENIELTRGWFQGRGVKTSPVKPVWGARSFYFFDPEGHRIEVWAKT